jgi:mRNA-degrading endonuclease RelE of RelBE toxin-antitoxin system
MALKLDAAAIKAMAALPRKERGQLLSRLDAIAAAPAKRHPSVKTMQGQPAGRYRVRQGDYRAIYVVVEGDVIVIDAGHRKEVYD